MTPRESKTTQADDYKKRQEIWQEALDTTQNHVELGQTLQAQGLALLASVQEMKSELSDLTKGIQQATNTIDKGILIERSAHRERIGLQQIKPKSK